MRALAGRRRVLLQLGRRGQRGRDQARAQGAPARRRVVAHQRVPRAHLRRAVGDAAGGQAGAVRAAGARASGRCRRVEIPAAVDEHTAAVLIEPVQGESGVNLIDLELLAVDPRGLRRGRRRAGVRRGPDRHGPDRLAVGLRADRRRPGRDDAGQGPRRRAADRRARDRGAAAGRLRARRPRLDLRRRAGRVDRGAHAVLDVDRRRGLPARRARAAASGCSKACASSPASCPRAGAG